MSLRLLSVILLVGGFASDASALVERRVERRFEVTSTASLKIDTFSGNVRILRGQANVITVTVIEQAEVEKEARMDARLKDFDLRMEQKDTGVSVFARYGKHLIWSWTDWPPFQLSYEIKVPAQCDIQVITGAGGIVLGSLQGKMDLANDSGPIFTGEIDGSIKARSRVGDIALTACSGDITAHTRSGNITVGRAFGRTELSSDGGYIELQRAAGEVIVRGSGSDTKVGFVPPVEKPASITTSGGGISLVLETVSACTLDLNASVFGRVKVHNLSIAITGGGDGHSDLAGTINGGGPLIRADANGGNIFVRGLDPIPMAAVDDPTVLPQK
ncbi:MAG TPA: hypothetical protein VL357_04635 [Rariglobus sp.]|nr:hypothetical protein [Rariglobus sp.]